MIETLIAPNPGPLTLDGTRTYVIDRRIVIDPGPLVGSHTAAIVAAAPDLEAIFVTHRHADHAPGATPLRRDGAIPLYGPAGAVDPRLLDIEVSDGTTYRFGEIELTAIATPGHTAEHFCYLTGSGELFTGDTVLGEGTTAIFPPDGNMGDYIRSLERLLALRPASIYPGHGPVRQDGVQLIESYLEHRKGRERQVTGQLSSGPATVEQIRAAIYPELDPSLHSAAAVQVEAHLLSLQQEGRARREGELWHLL
jgi:glyoxylase-like metal-dependent hydrolase (beta-lactamase superfamily II)